MTAVSEVLGALGFTCVADDDGGLAFSGPGGRGHAFEDSPESVRVCLELNGDLMDLARRSVKVVRPIRIVVRGRVASAEARCRVEELPDVLRRMTELPDADIAAVDLTVGVLAVSLPALDPPVFLRLAGASSPTVDLARATYVLAANADLRAGRGGWIHGPGVAVDSGPVDRALLCAELHEAGHALALLGDEWIARSYLELRGALVTTEPRAPAAAGPGASTEGGSR